MTASENTAPPTIAAPGSAPAPAPAPRRTVGRVLTVAGVVVAVVLVAQGAAQLLSWMFAQTTSAGESLAATDVVELVTDGRVEVVAADVDEMRVDRTATYAWVEPRYEVAVDGDRTVVRHECPTIPVALRCTADLTAEVPEGTRVVVRSVDGAVRVTGAVGGADLRTVDGGVTVVGADGDVSVRGVDGDVSLDGVAGDVDVWLTNGRLTVVGADGDVTARAVDGSSSMSGVGGDVELRTTNGRVDVRDVRGALTVEGTDGNVEVAAVRGHVSVRTVDGNVTVRGTGDPVALTVSSTGRQRVEAPTDPDADVRVDLRAVDGDVAYLGPEG